MAKMVNISDLTIKVKIATGPGAEPMITEIGAQEAAQFPDGYCRPVKGAGAAMLPCVLSRAHKHYGVPILVPEGEAEEARKRYLNTRAAHEVKDANPQATIRRLEAELAVAKAMGVKAKADAGKQSAKPDNEDLTAATTPKRRRGRPPKSEAKG